jgi:hypothetical protein
MSSKREAIPIAKNSVKKVQQDNSLLSEVYEVII